MRLTTTVVALALLGLTACSSTKDAVDAAGANAVEEATAVVDAGAATQAFADALNGRDFAAAEIELAKLTEVEGIDFDALIREFDDAREVHAGALVRDSVSALGSGDSDRATQLAAEVVTAFPETDAASGARELLASIAGPADPDLEADPGVILASSKGADKRIREASKYLERGERRNLDALQKSGSAARKSYEGSLSDYGKAIDRLDAAVKDKDASPEQRIAAQDLRDKALNSKVDVHLNTARVYLHRGSYDDAQSAVAEALALNPDHEGALDMQRTVDSVWSERARVVKLRKRGGKKWRIAPPSP